MIIPSGASFQDDYKAYLSRAMQLIHSPQTSNGIVNMLRGKNPVQLVANAAVMVMQRVDAASRQAGIEVQDSVKAAAAAQIVNEVVEVGHAARAFNLSKDLVELALATAVQDYVKGEIQAGRMNAQKVQVQMQADLRKLPPAKRKEIQQTQMRLQQTARKYNGGQ